eukprot:CAMPEP_0119412484 /NCGR_PEP_ID=MMETSP1335-20130426/4907_1 /TAXON_ID=259385 /ORGANISM="Chrysoculter rhomboideus, Strain RCC1486" /LENGTH=959 /DNA_ID=CAMNT_0007437225 /DNA_START=56 /DNA_END=2935 /DNA_ORIENTATION=+
MTSAVHHHFPTLLLAGMLLLARSSLGYDVGDDVTLCWKTDMTTRIRVREDCGAAHTTFTFDWPDVLYSSTEYPVTFDAYIPSDNLALSTVGEADYHIPHANIHSCVRSVGFCTPFVANTPGLSTHSPTVYGNVSADTRIATFSSAVELEPLQYTIIAHIRWFDTNGDKHDMARAVFKNFREPPDPPPPVFDCPAGNVYAVEDNEAFCSPCPKGTYEQGGKVCTLCPATEYNDETGKAECKQCPPNAQFLIASGQEQIPLVPAEGAQNRTSCACLEGFYTPKGQKSGSECLPCPEGAECRGNGDDVRIVPVPVPGWYQRSADTEVMLECVSAVACPGGAVAACNDGFEDDLCSSCADDYYKTSSGCEACKGGNRAGAYLAFVIFGVLAAWLHFTANLDRSGGTMRSTITAAAEVQSTVVFLQVFNLLLSLSVEWPPEIAALMDFFAWINLDVTVLSFECSFPMDFPALWRLKVAFPFYFVAVYLVFTALMAVRHFIKQRDEIAEAVEASLRTLYRAINASFLALSVLYVGTATTVIQAFICNEQPDGSHTFAPYPALECSSDEFNREIMPTAYFGLIVIVIGYPALLALIFAFGAEGKSKAIKALTSIVRTPYKDKFYFWECFDLARKGLIALTLNFGGFMSAGMQVAICSVLILIAFSAQLVFRPYKHVLVNFVTAYVLSVLLLMLIVANMILSESAASADGSITFGLQKALVAVVYTGVLSALTVSVGGVFYAARLFFLSKRTGLLLAHQVCVSPELVDATKQLFEKVSGEELVETTKLLVMDEDLHITFNESMCLLFALCNKISSEKAGSPSVKRMSSPSKRISVANSFAKKWKQNTDNEIGDDILQDTEPLNEMNKLGTVGRWKTFNLIAEGNPVQVRSNLRMPRTSTEPGAERVYKISQVLPQLQHYDSEIRPLTGEAPQIPDMEQQEPGQAEPIELAPAPARLAWRRSSGDAPP